MTTDTAKQSSEDLSDRVKIQPFVLPDTHRILRVAAADQNVSFGEIIDQWAAAYKEGSLHV